MNFNQSTIISSPPLDSSHDPQSITSALSGSVVRSSYGPLYLLLVAFVLFLAVDVAFHVRHWSQRPPTSSSVVTPLPKALVEIPERLLITFREFLASAKHAKYIEPEHHLIANDLLDKDNAELKRKNAHLTSTLASMDKDRKDNAFTRFRERLLLTNEVWQHEKEIKVLRAALESTKKAMRENAFAAFCDRLLLTNRVWKQEREIKGLQDGGERMKRARIAGIQGIARRMVLDVRKENLIEELVKDLIEEVEVSKREVTMLHSAHKREVEEINSEWIMDYRKLARELEKLKLGQQARLVEQEVANELEQSLLDSLRSSKRKAEDLEDRLWEYKKLLFSTSFSDMPLASVCGSCAASDVGKDIFEDDLDRSSSDISMSSTCVADESWPGVSAKSAGLGGLSMMERVCTADPGTRSFTTHLPPHALIEGSFPSKPQSLASLATPNGLPKVFRFNPVLLDRADKSSALVMNMNAARVCTTSGQPLPGCRRTKSVPRRLPLWSSHASNYRASVSSTDSSFASRSAKRVKFDSRQV